MKNSEKDLEKAQKAKIEFMRAQVQELELQARYWKSQWETKYYTLEDAKLRDEYNAYIVKTQEDYLNELAAEREAQKVADAIDQDLYPSLTNEEAPQ